MLKIYGAKPYQFDKGEGSTALTIQADICEYFITAILCKRVETLHGLLKRIFWSWTFLFSFTPPPYFNVVTATKSIGQSNILNIEKGEGGINRTQCNFIENEEKSRDYS